MDENKENIESQPNPTAIEPEPAFKSSFKAWIRVVAFFVVAVFLPEQAAQAAQYDWRVLWQKPASTAFTPAYLNDVRSLDIPLAVKNILSDIAGKPITEIKISPTVAVKLEKPLNISRQRIDEIFNWLKGRPCGSKALSDLLSYRGISASDQDAAVLALTVDILNNVVKPQGDPKIIKNSMHALAKAGEFFGINLYPVRVKEGASLKEALPVPFIAHYKGDHYTLVTNVTEDKVYFI